MRSLEEIAKVSVLDQLMIINRQSWSLQHLLSLETTNVNVMICTNQRHSESSHWNHLIDSIFSREKHRPGIYFIEHTTSRASVEQVWATPSRRSVKKNSAQRQRLTADTSDLTCTIYDHWSLVTRHFVQHSYAMNTPQDVWMISPWHQAFMSPVVVSSSALWRSGSERG